MFVKYIDLYLWTDCHLTTALNCKSFDLSSSFTNFLFHLCFFNYSTNFENMWIQVRLSRFGMSLNLIRSTLPPVLSRFSLLIILMATWFYFWLDFNTATNSSLAFCWLLFVVQTLNMIWKVLIKVWIKFNLEFYFRFQICAIFYNVQKKFVFYIIDGATVEIESLRARVFPSS